MFQCNYTRLFSFYQQKSGPPPSRAPTAMNLVIGSKTSRDLSQTSVAWLLQSWRSKGRVQTAIMQILRAKFDLAKLQIVPHPFVCHFPDPLVLSFRIPSSCPSRSVRQPRHARLWRIRALLSTSKIRKWNRRQRRRSLSTATSATSVQHLTAGGQNSMSTSAWNMVRWTPGPNRDLLVLRIAVRQHSTWRPSSVNTSLWIMTVNHTHPHTHAICTGTHARAFARTHTHARTHSRTHTHARTHARANTPGVYAHFNM